MNAVIDEDLHRSLAAVLTSVGFKVFDIRDYGLRGKSDDEIFKFAQEKEAVLFSADLGFGNTFDFPLGTHKGICILRFPNELSALAINTEVKKLLAQLIKPQDYIGNLIIISPGKIRLRSKEN